MQRALHHIEALPDVQQEELAARILAQLGLAGGVSSGSEAPPFARVITEAARPARRKASIDASLETLRDEWDDVTS